MAPGHDGDQADPAASARYRIGRLTNPLTAAEFTSRYQSARNVSTSTASALWHMTSGVH